MVLKTLILISLAAALLIVFYLPKKSISQEPINHTEDLQIQIKEFIDFMESVKGDMPKELLETHNYLTEKISKRSLNLNKVSPKLQNLIVYHGARTQTIYINPEKKLSNEIWIPIFYHEVAHNYWNSINPTETFEQFKDHLFDSEVYAYTISSQAWIFVKEHFSVSREDLNKEEQRLGDGYERESIAYLENVNGNSKRWLNIIEENLKLQKVYQEKIFSN